MLVLIIISIFLTINIELGFFLLQLKGKYITKWLKTKDFLFHSIITIFLWLYTFTLITIFQFKPQIKFHNSLFLEVFGGGIMVLGLIIATWGFIILGSKRSLGINFYRKEIPITKKSIYQWIKNPEEFGFWGMMIGFAFLTGSIYNLIFALEFVILMIPHQTIENIPINQRNL